MPNAPNVQVDYKLFLFLPVVLLVVPIRFLIAWLLAATIHEIGHFLALYFLRIRIEFIHIGIDGAIISVDNCDRCSELISALAGPLLGCLLILLAQLWPCIALCAAIQTLYNLLPIPGHDGDRVLASMLYLIIPSKASLWIKTYRILFGFLFVSIIAYISYAYQNIYIALVFAGVILGKVVKIPCKQDKLIVQ